MKLYTVSNDPALPCFVLRACNCTILLECPLDLTPLLHFVPLHPVPSSRLQNLPNWQIKDSNVSSKLDLNLKECSGHVLIKSTPEVNPPQFVVVSVEEIDIVLISNYNSMLGLPYLTEQQGFRAQIYVTEPTRMMARMLMEEMAEYFENGATDHHSTKWKNYLSYLPIPLKEQVNCKRWRKGFTRTELHRSFSYISLINHDESKTVPEHLTFTPISSGYGVGGCNWILNLNGVKFGYVSHSSIVSPHAKAMERRRLKDCDILLFGGVHQGVGTPPQLRLAEFCGVVENTLRNGGNVIVPSFLTDNMYDLVDTLAAHFESRGITNVPVYVASPCGPDFLGHANIFCEWVTDDRRVRVFIGDSPFQHIQMMQMRKLKAYNRLHEKFNEDLEVPCVLFTSHPLLRFGFAGHFLEMWGQNRNNLVIFTEPRYNNILALAPYQPLQIKVIQCTIDVTLSLEQLNTLLQEWQPKQLLSHPCYLAPPSPAPHLAHIKLNVPEGCIYHPCTTNKVLHIRTRRDYQTILVEPQVKLPSNLTCFQVLV